MKIYLDMDGVLANFDKQYELVFGARPTDIKDRTKHFWSHWDEFVTGKNFTKLELLPDAKTLMKACDLLQVPVEILSSTGNEKYYNEIAAQKTEWLKAHGITYKTNFVAGGSKKAQFADPWNILVDDTPKVVDAYVKAGGTAILHTDADTTIKQLLKLYLEYRGGQ
jgi:hypothetical protein